MLKSTNRQLEIITTKQAAEGKIYVKEMEQFYFLFGKSDIIHNPD